MRTNHRSAILLALFLAGHPVQAQDISSFWRDTLERLAAEPIDAREADLREPLPYKSMRVEYRSLGGVRVRALLALPHPRVANHPAGCLQSSRFRATAALLYGSGSRRSASLASIGSAVRRSRVSRQNEEISWAWMGCPARKSASRIAKR